MRGQNHTTEEACTAWAQVEMGFAKETSGMVKLLRAIYLEGGVGEYGTQSDNTNTKTEKDGNAPRYFSSREETVVWVSVIVNNNDQI